MLIPATVSAIFRKTNGFFFCRFNTGFKMNDKNQDERFAVYATASFAFNTTLKSTVGTSKPLINLQLMHWKEAKQRYFEYQNNLSTEDMIFIIDHLINSLSALFGANFPGDREKKTPQLKQLINNRRSESNIKIDKTVYRSLLDLADYYDATVRHHDQSKRTRALDLTVTTIERFLETTKRIWIWFGETFYPNCKIPEYLSIEFKDDFYLFPE